MTWSLQLIMLCLKRVTDSAWVSAALGNIDAVLVDHAHCEMKAASNALSLAVRHPADLALVRGLTEVAREEITHFERVLALLEARGVELGPPPVDEYAARLRRAVCGLRKVPGTLLVDRLLACALIEARSCERFKLLADAVADGGDPVLGALWGELLAAEAQHYRVFVDWAVRCAGGERASVIARLDAIADVEAAVVEELAQRPCTVRRAIHG